MECEVKIEYTRMLACFFQFQEIFDNIRRLEKQRRINNQPPAPVNVLWSEASIKDQLFSRPSNSSDRSSFRVQYSPEKGRHWIATKNVAPGQLVWVEESGPGRFANFTSGNLS